MTIGAVRSRSDFHCRHRGALATLCILLCALLMVQWNVTFVDQTHHSAGLAHAPSAIAGALIGHDTSQYSHDDAHFETDAELSEGAADHHHHAEGAQMVPIIPTSPLLQAPADRMSLSLTRSASTTSSWWAAPDRPPKICCVQSPD